MHQPQVALLSRPLPLLLLLWLPVSLACRQPEPPATAPPPPVRLHWQQRGAVQVPPAQSGASSGFPFAGAAELLAQCATPPCTAELWQAEETGVQRALLRTVESVRWADAAETAPPWPARWRRLNGALALCLGSPLALPPGGDLGGRRILVATDPPHADPLAEWQLSFSGQSACLLEGTLILPATRDRVGTRALRCDGQAWGSGGRERARSLVGLSE